MAKRPLFLLALLLGTSAAAQTGPLTPYSLWGQLWASAFGQWSVRSLTQTTAAGTVTLSLDTSAPPVLPGNVQFQPLATDAPLLIDTGANQETATPSAVNCSWGSGICQITITLAKAHPAQFFVSSATYGLQEAINYAHQAGGTVTLDPLWQGITSQVTGAAGYSNVEIIDQRTGQWTWYGWNGSNYAVAFGINDPAAGIGPITVTSINASTYYAEQMGGINAAVATLGSAKAVLACTTPQTLTADLAIPATLTVAPQPGCVITLGAYNLTLDSPPTAGAWQIFNQNSTGIVQFGTTNSAVSDRPEWWGAVPNGSTDSAPAIQDAIQVWSPASTSQGGTVQFGSGQYYIGENVAIDRGATLQGNSAGTSGSDITGTTILTAPGTGLYTTYSGPDAGTGNGSAMRDLMVACNQCMDTVSGLTPGLTTLTIAHPSYWAVNDLITGFGIPYNTYVTAVGSSTITISQATIHAEDGSYVFVGATAAQMLSGTFSTSTCTITSPSSTAGLFVGENIQGPSLPAQAFIRGIVSGTITFSAGDAGSCTDGTASGVADFWPVKSAIDVTARLYLYNTTVSGTGGAGINLSGNVCSDCADSNYTNVNGAKVQDIAAYYTGLDGVRMHGTDANAIVTDNLDLAWNALSCMEDDGASNTHTGTQVVGCGQYAIYAPLSGDAFVGGYTEINSAPTVLNQHSVAPMGGGGGSASWFDSGPHVEHNDTGKYFAASPLASGNATYSSTCISGISPAATVFHIGQAIQDDEDGAVIPSGTTVTAVNTCGGGSNTITMSAEALQTFPGLGLYAEIPYGTVANAGSADTAGNSALGLAVATPYGTYEDAYQWNFGPGVYDQYGAPFTYLDGTWELAHGVDWFTGMDLSTEESTQGDFPSPYYGYVRFPLGPYIGTFGAECHEAAPVNALPTSGSYNPCDTAVDHAPSGGVWAWAALAGGKSASGSGTLTVGSATITGLNTAGQDTFAPGDSLSGNGIAPGATIASMSGSSLLMSLPATAGGGETLTAVRYGKAHPATTITTTSGSASATLSSGIGWAQYDTILCSTCASGTYVVTISGTSVTLSQNATGTASGTTAYDAIFGEVPAGPAGATAQVALGWSLTTSGSTTDAVTAIGISSSSKCSWAAMNSTAAADAANIYLVVSSGQITVHHSAAAGEIMTGICTPE